MDYQEASDLLDRTSVMPVAPIKAERWRNVIFDRSGKSHLGVNIFNSEKEARQTIDNAETGFASGKYNGIKTASGRIGAEDYAYTLQMPVTE